MKMEFDSASAPVDPSVEQDSPFGPSASWLAPAHLGQLNTDFFASPTSTPTTSHLLSSSHHTFDQDMNLLQDCRPTPSFHHHIVHQPSGMSTGPTEPCLTTQTSSGPVGLSFGQVAIGSHWPSMLARRNSLQQIGQISAGSNPSAAAAAAVAAASAAASTSSPMSGHVISSTAGSTGSTNPTPLFPAPSLSRADTTSPSRGAIGLVQVQIPTQGLHLHHHHHQSHSRPTRQVPTPRKTLTDTDRKRMCEFHEQHPTVKQTDIGAIFGVERSTVSKVLRLKEKYLKKNSDDPLKSPIRSPIRKVRSKPADVERALATWLRNQEDKRGKPIEDDELRQRYGYFANLIGCTEEQPAKCDQTGWADSFRHRHMLLPRLNPVVGSSMTGHTVTMSPSAAPSTAFSPMSDIQSAVLGSRSPPPHASIDSRLYDQKSRKSSVGSGPSRDVNMDVDRAVDGDGLQSVKSDQQDRQSSEKVEDVAAALATTTTTTNTTVTAGSGIGDSGMGEQDSGSDDLSGLPVALRPESVRAGSQSPLMVAPSPSGSSTRSVKKLSPMAASLPPLTTTGLNPPSTLRSAGGAGSATSQRAMMSGGGVTGGIGSAISNSTPLTSSTTSSFRYFQSPMTPNSSDPIGAIADVSVYPLTPSGNSGLMLDSATLSATAGGHAFGFHPATTTSQNGLLFKQQRRGTMGPPAPIGPMHISTTTTGLVNPSSMGVAPPHLMYGPRRAGSFTVVGSHVPSPLQCTPVTGVGSPSDTPTRVQACAAIEILMRYLQNSQLEVEPDDIHHLSKVAERLQSPTSPTRLGLSVPIGHSTESDLNAASGREGIDVSLSLPLSSTKDPIFTSMQTITATLPADSNPMNLPGLDMSNSITRTSSPLPTMLGSKSGLGVFGMDGVQITGSNELDGFVDDAMILQAGFGSIESSMYLGHHHHHHSHPTAGGESVIPDTNSAVG